MRRHRLLQYGHKKKLRTKNRTELTGIETEVTETEIFGPRFGSRFPETEIITVNSVPAVTPQVFATS